MNEKFIRTYYLIFLFAFFVVFSGCSQKPNIQPGTTKQNLSDQTEIHKISQFDEICKYAQMSKDEVLKSLGKYEVISTGAEGSFEGYDFKNEGITITFDDNNKVAFIDCDNTVDINGAKAGMKFSEVQKKLGETPVLQSWVETPENKAWEIKYTLNNCVVTFRSYQKDGNDSVVIVLPDRKRL